MGTLRSAYGRYRLATAAPRPAAGFESRWTAVRNVMLHDRTSRPRPDGRALVTRGGVEPVVPQMWAERAAGLLRRGELAVIPAAPHNSNYTAADRLAPVVLGFLERRTGPAAGR